MRYPLFVILFCYVTTVTHANDLLTLKEYIQLVLQYHPVALQTNLLIKKGEAELLSAQGIFDPQLSFNFDNKTLDGKNYYQYIQPQIKVPLWYGIELKSELLQATGNNIDNEFTYGNSIATGISIPLLSGLVMNKKMASLKQAKNNIKLAAWEQQVVLNNLLIDAINTYWSWYNSYRIWQQYEQAIIIAQERLAYTRSLAIIGERALIDTLEAFTQYQQIAYEQQSAFYKWLGNTINLSIYLWDETTHQVVLREGIIPDVTQINFPIPSLNELELLSSNHPKINSISTKLKNLSIEQQLKKQFLLPQLDVQYNFINKTFNPFYRLNDNLLQNNYKIGVQFSMPLMFKSARGDLAQTKIKIQETKLEQEYLMAAIETKLKAYLNEIVGLNQTTESYSKILIAYQKLFDAELIKFNNGESSLFLINSRQNKVIEAQLKLIELQTKLNQYKSTIYLVGGVWNYK